MITPEMAATSNLQSVITRAIGAAETVEPDFFAAELQPDDILLLATDGLTRYLQPEEIAASLLAQAELPAICQTLVELPSNEAAQTTSPALCCAPWKHPLPSSNRKSVIT